MTYEEYTGKTSRAPADIERAWQLETGMVLLTPHEDLKDMSWQARICFGPKPYLFVRDRWWCRLLISLRLASR